MHKNARELLQRIRENAGYAESVEEIREEIESTIELLETRAINLAACGVWRHWSEAKQDGEQVTFDPEDLLRCGDANVEAILRASSALRYTKAQLRDEAPEERDGGPGEY